MLVREIVVRQIVHIELRPPVGLIVDPLAAFFLHRVALVIQVGLRDVQRAHAISLEKQSQIKLVFRQLLEVRGAVFICCAVHSAAVVQHLDKMFALSNILRALKHHVLEKMCKAGSAGPFVPAPDVIRDVDRIDRRRVLRHQNHAQPVVELHFAQFQLRQFHLIITIRGRLQRRR